MLLLIQPNGKTLIELLCHFNRLSCLKHCIFHGVNVYDLTFDGLRTPLMIACKAKYALETVQFLVEEVGVALHALDQVQLIPLLCFCLRVPNALLDIYL